MAKILAKSDSHDGLRDKLRKAIKTKHGDGSEYSYMGNTSVHDVFPGQVVHTIANKPGKMFASPYTQEEKTGAVTLGDPRAVEPAYKPMNEAAHGFIGEAVEFKEASYDKSSGKLKVRVIQPGFNTSKSRFYPATTLKRDHKIFEGAKMFANHQTKKEMMERPEGDVRDWVANLVETSVAPDGSIVGVAQVHDGPFKDKLAGLQESGLLHEMGISIRAAGLQQEAEVQGTRTMWVESFTKAKSVDFVTYPGAGGRVEMMESDKDDIDFITVERLAELRPDIVKHFTESAKEAANVEKTLEQLQAELQESQRQNAELQKTIAKQGVATKLNTLLTEAKLPEPADKRLRAQFAEATEEKGIAEAIAAEVEYIKALGGPKPADPTPTSAGRGKVRNMGEAHNGAAPADKKTSIEENVKAWMAIGMTEAQARDAATNISE